MILLENGVIKIEEVSNENSWPNECEVCNAPITKVITIKNQKYGYDKVYRMCEEHFMEMVNGIGNYYNINK